jgi:biotin carboxylase
MGDTTARYFRDKLAMRARARDRGMRVPEFVHVLNHDRIREYVSRVPPPWVLKPRGEASSVGIKKVHSESELWPLIDELGDRQSFFLLEKMIPGDVYHVDSIVSERQVVFAEAHRYRRPILEVTQEGGIFATRTVPRGGDEERALLAMNREVMEQFGILRGVSHTEFIRGNDDGQYYFLETAARVGGANISDLVEASTGVNLWEEWAKIEITQGEKPYTPPASPRKDYAGLVVSLARQEWPDISQFDDREVVWRLREKKHHVGLVVKSERPERIEALIEAYIPRIQRDYHAAMPPPERPTA